MKCPSIRQMNTIKTTFPFFISLLLVLVFTKCAKDDDQIENVYVDAYLNTTLPSYNNLVVVGGWVYIPGGVKGIIVYRRNNDEFVAFDRICTYKPAEGCAVAVDSSNIIATDACCGSRFQLTDGIVIKGPASRGLKQYMATFTNGVVHVYNY